MGATVDWDNATRTVTASRGNMDLILPLGSRIATVNGREVTLDVPARTMGGSTMVPLRFIGEALGARVSWENPTQTVYIETEGRRGVAAYRDRPSDRVNTVDRRTARAYRRASRVSLPTGTVIPVQLDEELGSDISRVGDTFTATVVSGSTDAGLPEGTKVEGVVREAISSRNGKPGVLDVDFTRIKFPGGESKVLDGRLTSLDSKSVERTESGRLTAKAGRSDQERLKWVGIGAGAGLLISTLTKGNALVDTLLGAGAGYLYDALQRKGAGNVSLKSGTEFGVKLDKPLSYTADISDRNYRDDRDR
jgi:hypothetical protein